MPILLYNKRMKSKAVGCCDYNASHQRSVMKEGDKSDVAIINISYEVTAFCNVAYYLYDKRIKLLPVCAPCTPVQDWYWNRTNQTHF